MLLRDQLHRGGEIRSPWGPQGHGRPLHVEGEPEVFQWRPVSTSRWRHPDIPDVLILKAIYLSYQWRLRLTAEHRRRFPHFVDSLFAMGIYSKSRTSSQRLRHMSMKIAALVLAGQLWPVIARHRSLRAPPDKSAERHARKVHRLVLRPRSPDRQA